MAAANYHSAECHLTMKEPLRIKLVPSLIRHKILYSWKSLWGIKFHSLLCWRKSAETYMYIVVEHIMHMAKKCLQMRCSMLEYVFLLVCAITDIESSLWGQQQSCKSLRRGWFSTKCSKTTAEDCPQTKSMQLSMVLPGNVAFLKLSVLEFIAHLLNKTVQLYLVQFYSIWNTTTTNISCYTVFIGQIDLYGRKIFTFKWSS